MTATAPQEPISWLVLAATQARAGQIGAARATRAKVLPDLPPELRHVAALRQALFKLPDQSWGIFRDSLKLAGMPG